MFLDRCDICHKPKKCRGYKDMVLCDECIEMLKNNNESKVVVNKEDNKIQKELTIYDFL